MDSSLFAQTASPEILCLLRLAFTYHLMGYTEEAESLVQIAESIPIDPDKKSEVKRLMAYDIGLLQEEQEHLSAEADNFGEKIFSRTSL
jgi:hypothetical protein